MGDQQLHPQSLVICPSQLSANFFTYSKDQSIGLIGTTKKICDVIKKDAIVSDYFIASEELV